MAKGQRYLISPWRAVREMPISSCVIALLALYAAWLGADLIWVAAKLPVARQAGFSGPRSVMSLNMWGISFLVASAIGVARLFFFKHRRIDAALHAVKMGVIISWAVSFDLGPASTGQVAYTFVAVTSFVGPFLPGIILRRYGGRAAPNLVD